MLSPLVTNSSPGHHTACTPTKSPRLRTTLAMAQSPRIRTPVRTMTKASAAALTPLRSPVTSAVKSSRG